MAAGGHRSAGRVGTSTELAGRAPPPRRATGLAFDLRFKFPNFARPSLRRCSPAGMGACGYVPSTILSTANVLYSICMYGRASGSRACYIDVAFFSLYDRQGKVQKPKAKHQPERTEI